MVAPNLYPETRQEWVAIVDLQTGCKASATIDQMADQCPEGIDQHSYELGLFMGALIVANHMEAERKWQQQ